MARFSQLLMACGLLAGRTLGSTVLSPAAEVKQHLAEEEFTLLAFVAPEVDSSEALLQEWKTIQQEVEAAKAIDCTKASELCQELDVTSFPTIRLYQRDGPTTRYRGPRKAASIAAFVKRALRPVVQPLDIQKLTEFTTSDDITFVAQLQSKDENLASRFQDFASEFHDRFSFGLTVFPSSPSSVWCYNNPDSTQHMATELDSVDSLQRLMEICTAEAIPQLTRRNELKYLSSGKSLVYYFTNDDADRESFVQRMKHTAKKYGEFLKFVTVDSNEYPEMSQGVGIRSKTGLAVHNLHNGQAFPYNGDISPESINQFIVAISEGKIQAWDGTLDDGGAGHDEL